MTHTTKSERVAVVGLGLLGRGIATRFPGHGFEVVAVAHSHAQHARARAQITQMIEELIEVGGSEGSLRSEWASRYVAAAGLTFFGLVRSAAEVNAMPMLCMVADPRHRATGYGVMNLVGNGMAGLAIYAGGLLRDAHVNVSNLFLFGAACTALCSLVLCFVCPQPATVAISQETPP